MSAISKSHSLLGSLASTAMLCFALTAMSRGKPVQDESFNLVLELKLTAQEKVDLVAFMRVL